MNYSFNSIIQFNLNSELFNFVWFKVNHFSSIDNSKMKFFMKNHLSNTRDTHDPLNKRWTMKTFSTSSVQSCKMSWIWQIYPWHISYPVSTTTYTRWNTNQPVIIHLPISLLCCTRWENSQFEAKSLCLHLLAHQIQPFMKAPLSPGDNLLTHQYHYSFYQKNWCCAMIITQGWLANPSMEQCGPVHGWDFFHFNFLWQNYQEC